MESSKHGARGREDSAARKEAAAAPCPAPVSPRVGISCAAHPTSTGVTHDDWPPPWLTGISKALEIRSTSCPLSPLRVSFSWNRAAFKSAFVHFLDQAARSGNAIRYIPNVAAKLRPSGGANAEIPQSLSNRLRVDLPVGKLSFMEGPRLFNTDSIYMGPDRGIAIAPRDDGHGGPPPNTKSADSP